MSSSLLIRIDDIEYNTDISHSQHVFILASNYILGLKCGNV